MCKVVRQISLNTFGQISCFRESTMLWPKNVHAIACFVEPCEEPLTEWLEAPEVLEAMTEVAKLLDGLDKSDEYLQFDQQHLWFLGGT